MTDAGLDLNDLALQLAGLDLCVGALHILAMLRGGLGALNGVQRLRRGFLRKLSGNQVVAAVALGNLDDLILFSASLNIL